jgi:uncharacterized protein
VTAVVTDAVTRHRYEAQLEGETAGYLMYQRAAGQLVLVHTQVDPRFEGRGVGGTLARAAFEAARAEGTVVRVVCPFVVEWLRRHPEYQELTAPG